MKLPFLFVLIFWVSGIYSQNNVLVINEFLASNDAAVADQDEEFDDWIELYNNGSSDIDLSGYFLSDKTDNPEKWSFPDGTTIPGNGYLIIWADEDGSQDGLHANFKLSASGEDILLSDPDVVLLDMITFGEQKTDISFARNPNGTGDFVFKTPTFNDNNDNGTTNLNHVDFETNKIQVFPNPSTNELRVSTDNNDLSPMNIQLFSEMGKLVLKERFDSTEAVLKIENLPNGMYFLIVNDAFGKKVVISN